MNLIYSTVTGTNYYYGNGYFKPEIKLRPIKEPDNKVDKETIRAELEGPGKMGYVTNNSHSVIGDSYSVGQLYDKVRGVAEGKVLYVLPQGVFYTLVQGEEGEEPSLLRNAMRSKK